MASLRDALRDLPEAVFGDLLESEDAYLLVIDLPGATAESVDVEARLGRLHIEARREKGFEDYSFRREGRSTVLAADVPLPPDASPANASGQIERGVLELRLPKSGSTAGTTIHVEDA